jgi:uncharacterized protein
MSSILNLFQSSAKPFFDSFELMADCIDKMGKKLYEFTLVNSEEEHLSIIQQLQASEAELGKISHQIFLDLGTYFITPFDKEDVHQLASAIYKVGDYTNKSAKKIHAYKIAPSEPGIRAFAEVIEQSTVTLKAAILQLRSMKNLGSITNALVNVNKLENDADEIYYSNLKELFDSEKDAKMVLKKVEIYELMEIVTDLCEDTANVIETILVKHA